jgi:voltage-dependent calcium channel L type alpha-1D
LSQYILELINYTFSVIFGLEAIIKILALGIKYFNKGWNLFDFAIVIGYLLSIIVSKISYLNLKTATSIVRIFRVGRVLRLIKKASSLKIVFNTIIFTLPAMTNVGIILFLLIYLYAIVGVYLFAFVKINSVLNDRINF